MKRVIIILNLIVILALILNVNNNAFDISGNSKAILNSCELQSDPETLDQIDLSAHYDDLNWFNNNSFETFISTFTIAWIPDSFENFKSEFFSSIWQPPKFI
jgi:hypothetical protein